MENKIQNIVQKQSLNLIKDELFRVSVTWKCPEPCTEKMRMMRLFSWKAFISLVSLLGVVDQMPFC